MTTMTMAIKLEGNDEPCLTVAASNSIQTQRLTLAPDPVDKKPVIVVRANAAQLTILNASFAKTESPNKLELDKNCKETGLTPKWIKSWYGRKRRSQKKALGIQAVKTEEGDPMISGSGAGAVSDIPPKLQSRPLRPANENVTVAAQVPPSRKDGARTARTPLSPSPRYAPYKISKKAVTPSAVSSSADDLRLHPSNKPQYQSPTSLRLPDSTSNNTISLSSPSTENTHCAPEMLQSADHNLNFAYTWPANPDASSSYPAKYNPDTYIYDTSSSTNQLPAFDINANTNVYNNTSIGMPVHLQDYLAHIPPQMQDWNALHGPLTMDDSAFVSFSHYRQEYQEGSRSQGKSEVVDVGRSGQDSQYSQFPDYLLGTGIRMAIDSDLEHSWPFSHLRQEEEMPQSQTRRKAADILGTEFVAPSFDPPPQATTDQSRSEPSKWPSAFPGSKMFSTLSHFPATPIRIPTTPKNYYGATPVTFSPSFQPSPHQYNPNPSPEESLSHHRPLMIPTSIPTPSKFNPTSNNDIYSGLQTAESDLANLTLHALATEEDTFTAAIMLVVLSKVGFVWNR